MNKEQIIQKIKCSVIVLITCLFLLLFSPQIISFLHNIVKWIEPCPQWCFAILFSFLAIKLTVKIAYINYRNKLHISDCSFAFVMLMTIVYSFFRFFNHEFEFWPIESIYKWTDILYAPCILIFFLKFINKKRITPSHQPVLFADNPITKPKEDYLDYDQLSEGLLNDLNATDISNKSYSVGIVGSWGQGKSSFLNLLKLHTVEQGSIVVTFNPRSSKSIRSIQEDFFDTLKEELSSYHTGIRRHLTNYTNAVANNDDGWFGKIALALNELTQSEEKERINCIIRQINKPIFIIIEDFDRLTGKEIVEVLKLIDANGAFCNTIYLTAYDKKYVNEALKSYLGFSPDSPFTDKYFNYEYSLPICSPKVTKKYFKKLITDNIEIPSNSIHNKEYLLEGWDKVGDLVVRYLPNLRHIKRYYNIFVSRYCKIMNDVDISDFMLLTLLRYKDIEAYNALFNFTFLRRGNLVIGGSEKVIYLENDYLNNSTFKGLASESKQIIEKLFFVEKDIYSISTQDAYGKICWDSSFYNYFYDYRIGEYHIENFINLFKLDETEAYNTIKEISESGYSQQLEDFLFSRKPSWITSATELDRYIKLIIHLDKLNKSISLKGLLRLFIIKSNQKEYLKLDFIKNEDTYENIIYNAFRSSLNSCPLEVGDVCLQVLEEYNTEGITDDFMAIKPKKIIDLAVLAQKQYYSKYPNGDYIFDEILNLAYIRKKRGKKNIVVKQAQEQLMSLMDSYPLQFATNVIISNVYKIGNVSYLMLQFHRNFHFTEFFENSKNLIDNWINNIPDEHALYVVKSIVSHHKDPEGLTVPALKEKYSRDDFEGFYKAIISKENLDDEQAVWKAINNNNMPDLYSLEIATSLTRKKIKPALKRLVDKNKIDKEYLTLKERIEPFEKGDLVKLRPDVFKAVSNELLFINNIFKITELSVDGIVRLNYLSQPTPIANIEAIKIDGVQDRDIYYDPVVIPIVVADNTQTPAMSNHRGEYYMDSLRNTTDKDKNFEQLVMEADCRYVHEVQHYLRKHYGSDDLKVDYHINPGGRRDRY